AVLCLSRTEGIESGERLGAPAGREGESREERVGLLPAVTERVQKSRRLGRSFEGALDGLSLALLASVGEEQPGIRGGIARIRHSSKPGDERALGVLPFPAFLERLGERRPRPRLEARTELRRGGGGGQSGGEVHRQRRARTAVPVVPRPQGKERRDDLGTAQAWI